MESTISYHARFSWRSVAAGLLTSMIAFMVLSGLGFAFGGGGLDQESTLRGALTFAGIWSLVTVLVAIAIGSYVAARLSGFQLSRTGAMQGVVLAALVLSVMMWQAFAAAGWAGRAAASVVGGAASMVGQGAQAASQSAAINEIAEDALGDVNIAPERVQVIATGAASRLLRGNVEGARLYLSRQTGLTPLEADQRIAALRSRLDQAAVQARETASQAMISVGWTLFLTSFMSAAVGVFAGMLGAKHNSREPDVQTANRATPSFRPATV